MQARATSTTLVSTWVHEGSFLSDLGLVIAFSLFTGLPLLPGDTLKLLAMAAVLPAGWRLRR